MYILIYKCKINSKIWIVEKYDGGFPLPTFSFLKNFYFWNWYYLKNDTWFNEIIFKLSYKALTINSTDDDKFKFMFHGDKDPELKMKKIISDVVFADLYFFRIPENLNVLSNSQKNLA